MTSPVRFTLFLTLSAGLMAVLSSMALWLPSALAANEVAEAMQLPGDALSWGFAAAAAATGLSSLGAAYAVGRVGAAAIGALAEKEELFGRLVILVGLAEGIAIYGLIISVLILNRLV